MQFEEEEHLEVDLQSLIQSSTHRNEAKDRAVIKNKPDHKRFGRGSWREDTEESQSKGIMDFLGYFKWAKKKNEMIRTSYKDKNGEMYQLFGIAGDSGHEEIYLQTQKGFEDNLPPVRLSQKERQSLFQEYNEMAQERRSTATFDFMLLDERIADATSVSNQMEPLRSDFNSTTINHSTMNLPLAPSRDRHIRNARTPIKNNKTFWSSGFERPQKNIPRIPILESPKSITKKN